jgi:hypothetical protein
MITELLDAAINETLISNFEITEFQIGSEPMDILISEVKSSIGIPIEADITNLTNYKGIRVREHVSRDAVMYCLKLKVRKSDCTDFVKEDFQ